MFKLFFLIFALNIDTFLVSASLGAKKIKITKISVFIISFLSSLSLSISIILSTNLIEFIPSTLFDFLSFCILIFIGCYGIFSDFIKLYLSNMRILNKDIIHNKKHILMDIFIDEAKADMNNSKTLDAKESFLIALLGCFDSICAGLTFPLNNVLLPFILTFFICLTLIMTGFKLGNHLTTNIKINISWVGGVFLIALAFMKII